MAPFSRRRGGRQAYIGNGIAHRAAARYAIIEPIGAVNGLAKHLMTAGTWRHFVAPLSCWQMAFIEVEL